MRRTLILGCLAVAMAVGLTGETAFAQVSRAGSWTNGLAHTAGTGSDWLIVFYVGYENDNADDFGVNAVTYGGQSMTRITGDAALSGNNFLARGDLWYIDKAGIAAASGNTFNVTYGGTGLNDEHYAAATYENVDQTNPISDFSSNSTPNSNPNPIETTLNVENGSMAVAGALWETLAVISRGTMVGRREPIRPRPPVEARPPTIHPPRRALIPRGRRTTAPIVSSSSPRPSHPCASQRWIPTVTVTRPHERD